MTKPGFFSKKKLHEINKNLTKNTAEDLEIFNDPVYMSFVVTPEERAIIEDELNKHKGNTLTKQLLCLIKNLR